MDQNSLMENFQKFEEHFKNIYYKDLLPTGRPDTTENFLFEIFKMMFKFINKTADRNEKVIDFHHPAELKQLLDLKINDEPSCLQDILVDCENVLKYVVKTGHPRFFNNLFQGLDIISLAGEWLTATTNTNMNTYEIAPVYNLMEEVTLAKMRELIGWKEPGDGILNPGGAISNLFAIQVARHFYFPETKTQGLFNMPKLVIFSSEHSHYSVSQAAALTGIGLDQVKSVRVDERGKIVPSELEKLIKESKEKNEVPFLVVLTAGTTVFGAFDPLHPIADICAKYKLWLHVDSAWGGGVLLSRKHRYLMDGIERADSVTWNPHKIMNSLQQASAFLVKQPGLLLNCNKLGACYLFQKDKHYDVSYDIGDKTIQCGRHVDVFKVWLMLRAKGLDGFEKHIDRLMDLSKYLYEEIKKRENFEIVHHDVAPKIKEKMMVNGTVMVAYLPLNEKPNFFRMVISNGAAQKEDLDFLLNEIERFGIDL